MSNDAYNLLVYVWANRAPLIFRVPERSWIFKNPAFLELETIGLLRRAHMSPDEVQIKLTDKGKAVATLIGAVG